MRQCSSIVQDHPEGGGLSFSQEDQKRTCDINGVFTALLDPSTGPAQLRSEPDTHLQPTPGMVVVRELVREQHEDQGVCAEASAG